MLCLEERSQPKEGRSTLGMGVWQRRGRGRAGSSAML